MSRRKHGFINLLFDQTEISSPRKEQAAKQLECLQIKKLMEQNVFIPRNRLKNIRIVKINDTIAVKQQHNPAKPNKSMFVDGSHLTEFLPRRQLATSGFNRNMDHDRSYSPDARSKRSRKDSTSDFINQISLRLSHPMYEDQDGANPESKWDEGEGEKFETVKIFFAKEWENKQKDQYVSLENSTISSSNKNIKQKSAVRYRKIIQPEKKGDLQQKATLQLKKQLFRFYSNPFGNPDNITAKAFIVLEHFKQNNSKNTNKRIHIAFNSKINLQVASLTKIMTFLVTIQLCKKYKVDITTQKITIGAFQINVEGTTADLQQGQMYTIEQLLYGLMLPSGNDASIALSVFCGELLERKVEQSKKVEIQGQNNTRKHYYKKFVLQMNRKCIQLDMKRTFFSNSHGLANSLNRSCASDIALLINYSLENPLFRIIIATKEYQAIIHKKSASKLNKANLDQFCYESKVIKWQNTHKLIHSKSQIYKGIKTGTTQAAGPCLASLVELKQREFIIIVLHSKTSKSRYKDTQSLREWLFKKQQLISLNR